MLSCHFPNKSLAPKANNPTPKSLSQESGDFSNPKIPKWSSKQAVSTWPTIMEVVAMAAPI